MANAREHLKRWMDAGLIERETAERIEVWEQAQSPARSDAAERPGALEALLYLGVVVLGVGVFALLAQNWDDLASWARVTAIGVPTALLLAAGGAMRLSKEPQLERGSQLAWLVSVGLFAGLLAIILNEYHLGFGEHDDRGRLLTVAASTFGLSVTLWVLSPRHAQVLAVAAASFFLAQMIGNWPDEFSQTAAGMTLLGFGAAGVAMSEAKWLKPEVSGSFLFSVLLIAGPWEAGIGDGHIAFEFLAGVCAVGLIGYGVVRASFLLVIVGVAGTFWVLVTFIFEHFSERLGAPLALMISGGLVIAGVLLLAAYRREIDARKRLP